MSFIVRMIKRVLLSKIIVYIVVAIMVLAALSAWANVRYGNYAIRAIVGVIVSFSPYFIASIAFAAYLAKKYRPYLKKGKSTTVESIASSLKVKDVNSVKYEIQCLIDRGYLQGFTINHETNAITPSGKKATAQELRHAMTKTLSAFKNGVPEESSVCPKCGASYPDTDATNCEFCGTPVQK